MDDAYQALMIAFSAIVFVIALSASVFLITKITQTSEFLTYYADSTKFYDNIDIKRTATETEEEYQNRKKDIYSRSVRYVSAETIIPTLYRYNKENFCVKIYDNLRKLSSNI